MLRFIRARPPCGLIPIRIRHELSHYLLHRQRRVKFACSAEDIATGRDPEEDLEGEADEFAATLLMPLDDFRRQVADQPIGIDRLSGCADHYWVFLTAATLRWLDVVPGRAVLVVSRGATMLWAKASTAAFESGL